MFPSQHYGLFEAQLGFGTKESRELSMGSCQTDHGCWAFDETDERHSGNEDNSFINSLPSSLALSTLSLYRLLLFFVLDGKQEQSSRHEQIPTLEVVQVWKVSARHSLQLLSLASGLLPSSYLQLKYLPVMKHNYQHYRLL